MEAEGTGQSDFRSFVKTNSGKSDFFEGIAAMGGFRSARADFRAAMAEEAKERAVRDFHEAKGAELRQQGLIRASLRGPGDGRPRNQ